MWQEGFPWLCNNDDQAILFWETFCSCHFCECKFKHETYRTHHDRPHPHPWPVSAAVFNISRNDLRNKRISSRCWLGSIHSTVCHSVSTHRTFSLRARVIVTYCVVDRCSRPYEVFLPLSDSDGQFWYIRWILDSVVNGVVKLSLEYTSLNIWTIVSNIQSVRDMASSVYFADIVVCGLCG